MRIVTYNLRCDVAVDGVNRFSSRKGLVMDKIEAEKPEIIGFQEVTPPMNTYLREHLCGYTLVGCGRSMDYQGEHNPIAFNSEKYELIALDVTWLSPQPYEPGTRFETQSDCPRIITHAILRPVGEGEPFHVYNTHLDHMSSLARVLGARQLLSKIEADQEIHPFPLLLTGDFNAYPDAEEIQLLKNAPFGLNDFTENAGVTFHNWGKISEGQIDYIFGHGFASAAKAKKWTDEWNGVFLSDHYPVEITVFRKDGGAL